MPRIFCLLQSPAQQKSKESTPPQSLRFDPDVKIPSRGKSSLNSVINYTHAEEVEHQKICKELDALFSSGNSNDKSGTQQRSLSTMADPTTRGSTSQF